MNAITGLGKYLFALPFIGFGLFHFMGADAMAGMAPGGVGMVYFTGAALIAAGISMLIGKLDKLAAVLLAVMLLLFAFIVHAPNVTPENMEMGNILKNVALAGGALMYAHSLSRDHTAIG